VMGFPVPGEVDRSRSGSVATLRNLFRRPENGNARVTSTAGAQALWSACFVAPAPGLVL